MSSGVSKGNPAKGGSKTKSNKTDSKTDKADLNTHLKIQATAEQMQIARIMDSHRAEDPELQKKIKQVMEVTKVTEDEACMALHSREYDITQAITLLTEEGGENLQSEWEQAGKKKKAKAPAAKNDAPPKERGAKEGRERSEKRDGRNDKSDKDRKESEIADGQTVGNDQRGRSERGERGERGRGGRGRGRGGRGGGPGRVDNKENDESGTRSFGGNFGGRIANGPSRGGRGGRGGDRGGRGARDGTRTFASRTRGRDDDSTYNTIDVWENSQAEAPKDTAPLKVDKWDEFPSAEDWDNEEYTGSLQETKVFTPSTQTSQITPPLGDTTNGVGPNHLGNAVAPSVGTDVKISSVGGGDTLKDTAASAVSGLNSVPAGPTSVVPGQSIDLSMLLQKPQNSSNSTVSNAGANLLATLQSSYSNASQVSLGTTNQALPPRTKMQRPRGPTTTTKIPSSAVEMPVDSVATLDVQFGGLDFEDNASMNFNSVLSSNKPNADILYGAAPGKLDGFAAAAEKDSLSSKGAPPQQAPSPFQNQRPAPANLVETGASQPGGVPISPNIDSIALQNQKNTNSPQSAYVNSSNVASAFAPYGKGAPGFPAPGFPPVTQTPAGTVTYSNSTVGNGGSPGAPTAASYTSAAASQSSYIPIGVVRDPYASQPGVTEVQSSQIQAQPNLSSVSQSQAAYPGNTSQPTAAYHHGANSNTNAYGNPPAANSQYGNYGQKLPGSLTAQNVTTGHQTVKDSPSEANSSVPASGSSSANSVQIGSLQQGSGSTSNSNPKISTASNVPSTAAGGAKMGIPPGMVMPPQYILNQSGVPAFYSLPQPFYGLDENSVPFIPRMPHHIPGYYDAGAANYGNPMSFALEANAGGPPVSGRSDGTISSYSGGSDARFPRSDSSTASPVPSNIAGQNTQQPMYNPTLPYYFVGNNMMHPGTHFPYPPPYMHPTSAMATPTNASGAAHAATANHQYQNKAVYQPYPYDQGPPGPSTDFSKNSYAGGPGVGPNSSSGKTPSATSSGSSQSTELNSSMYGKGHLNKIPAYEKQFVNSGGGYNSMGAGTNPLNSQMSGAGIGAYNVYIAQQPVQPLPLPQDGSNASRQGSGQPKGNKQQYGGGPPYWPN